MDRVSSGGTTKIRYRDFIKHCEHSGLFVCPFHPQRVPVGSTSRGEDVTINVYDINPPSLPTPFNSVLVSVSVFMALSTLFQSINSSDNSPLSHSVLSVLFLPCWSFQLSISL